MPGQDGKKQKGAGAALPPKPALFSDEEWALAHSVPQLLELLASAPASADKASSSSTAAATADKDRPVASRAQVCGWRSTGQHHASAALHARALTSAACMLAGRAVALATAQHQR
jgi:hypothetical protein